MIAEQAGSGKRPSDPHFDLGRDKEAEKYSAREMQDMLGEITAR